jgi:hypothetical protein
MRRPDPLEWLLIAAALLAFAVLGQAVWVSANASLVETLTASVTASRADSAARAPESQAGERAGAGDLSGAVAAIDDTSTEMAAEVAGDLARGAVWLAVTSGALFLSLAAAVVVRARQLRRSAPPAQAAGGG